MRKMLIFGTLVLLTGCACPFGNCKDTAQAPVVAAPETAMVTTPETGEILQTEPVEYTPAMPVEVPAALAMPCSSSCGQPNCEPMVLKPRVIETAKTKKKRPCCDTGDEFTLFDDDEPIVPDAPEIYVISANRTVNSMLTEAEAFYKTVGAIKIYIDDEERRSDDLPGGMDKGTATLKKRFADMENITLVDDKTQADYIVNCSADWYDTATKVVPAIKFDLYLKNKDGSLFGEWSEIIHQAQGDRSWW